MGDVVLRTATLAHLLGMVAGRSPLPTLQFLPRWLWQLRGGRSRFLMMPSQEMTVKVIAFWA
ncbi:hypothetical protein [Altericista sp. CCNU0014]|uniref:hypothetical protein n=1 Tax=Altericista sp. CCNU0014 TaxID=3082949 RepID=UPI00384EA737